MTDHPCITELLEGKKELKKSEALQWLQELLDNSDGMSPDEVLETAKKIGGEKLRQAYVEHVQHIRMIRKEMETIGYLRGTWKDNPVEGIFSLLSGSAIRKKGSRNSAHYRQRFYETRFRNGLALDLVRKDVYQEYISGDLDRQIIEELHILNGGENGKPTGSKQAVEIAKIVKKHTDMNRNLFNKQGGDIRILKGYITEQTHDMYKIRAAGRDEWIDFVNKRLDREATFGTLKGDQVDKVINAVYDNIATGTQYRIPTNDPELKSFLRTFNIANSESNSRYLHFKSPQDWFEYNQKFGQGNLRETIDSQNVGLARGAALMEMLGPNPREMINRTIDTIGELGDMKTKDALKNNRHHFENVISELDGSSRIPGNHTLARYSSVFRSIQNMSKLGASVITAISDIPLSASELRYQGEGYLSSYHKAVTKTFNSVDPKHKKELQYMFDVYADGSLYDMTSRFSAQDDLPGFVSRMQGAFFKYNLLQPWTDRMRRNVGMALSARLGMLSDTKWGDLELDLRENLEMYDITEADWDIARSSVLTHEETGKKFISSETIKSEEVSAKFGTYFIDRSEVAVITPDARTTAMMHQGTRNGTVTGEFLRFVAQFKSFPVAVMQKVMGRNIYGKGHENAWEAIKNGSAVMAMAETIAMTTAFGYLSIMAKDAIKGREPRDPLSGKTMLASMIQGGSLGLYGDFLLNAHYAYGKSPLIEAMGPTAANVNQALQLMGALKGGQENLDEAAGLTFSLLKGNMPYANLFYTRAAMDYLIFHRMQEYISPGYLSRMEDRVKDEFDQDYFDWAQPSEWIPYGGGF